MKLRSAIKAKLIELGAYVSDELPDYIMVMLVNQRTKTQMEEDLGFFLNERATDFTNWLHDVLEKLKRVTLEKPKRKKMVSSEKPVMKVKKAKKKSGKEKGDRRMKEGILSLKVKAERSRRRKESKSPNVSIDDASWLGQGLIKQRKRSSSEGLGGSGGAEVYNPASLLKSALETTKENEKFSQKKSNKRSSRSFRKSKRKKDNGEIESAEKKESDDDRAKNYEEKSSNENRPKAKVFTQEETNFNAMRDRVGSVSGEPAWQQLRHEIKKGLREIYSAGGCPQQTQVQQIRQPCQSSMCNS